VLIEVGAGSKDCRQLVNTAAKVKADYGFAVCNDELELLEENILKMPLKYFLLI